jgi:hypothetical protein
MQLHREIGFFTLFGVKKNKKKLLHKFFYKYLGAQKKNNNFHCNFILLWIAMHIKYTKILMTHIFQHLGTKYLLTQNTKLYRNTKIITFINGIIATCFQVGKLVLSNVFTPQIPLKQINYV